MTSVQRTYARKKQVTADDSGPAPAAFAGLARLQDGEDDLTPPTSPAALILTPKSKIAAMLAELDKTPSESSPVRSALMTTAMTMAQDGVSPEEGSDEDIVLPGSRARSFSADANKQREPGTTSLSNTTTKQAQALSKTVAEIMADSDESAESDEARVQTASAKLSKRRKGSASPNGRAGEYSDPSDSDGDLSAVGPSTVRTPKLSKRERLLVLARQRREAAAAERESADEFSSSEGAINAVEEKAIATSIMEKDQTSGSGTESEDIEAEMRLSSARRPKRAASKKALEEMHKKTARMERGMGLVPEARVNKKLTVSDFFSKVGYGQKKSEETTAVVVDPASAVQAIQAAKAEVAPVDCEMAGPARSVSSPPPASSPTRKQALPYTLAFAPELEESDEEEDENMPTLAELMVAKAKSPTPECEPVQAIEEVEPQPKSEAEQVQPLPAPGSNDIVLEDSSEEEAPLPKHLKSHKLLFAKRDYAKIEKDRKAAKFHALARPDSPTKAEARLEKQRKAELLARVAWQAKAEREARKAALKAAGVTLPSAEERAKEAIEVEDLVERARRQAEELRKLEKAEDAKRKAVEDGVNDEEEEDEDYNGESPAQSNSSDADDSDNDGSEADSASEGEADEDADEASQQSAASPALEHSTSILSERALVDDDEDVPLQNRPLQRRRVNKRLLDDAESDEDKENAEPSNAPASPNHWGLTQFFEDTQADQSNAPKPHAPEDSFAALRAPINFDFGESLRKQQMTRNPVRDSRQIVPASQTSDPAVLPMATQFSVFGPLSDDDEELVLPAPGIANEFSQATQVDGSLTQALTEPVQVKAPGKLNRLRRALAGDVSTQMSQTKKVNPFRVMKEALNEEQTAKARKAFLDDRAIESDDEYAGLGGASDDDAEETAAMAKELDGMIDHEAQDLDSAGQAELAAMYAAKERELDAQLVTNLMNDINNGGLRKKRGAGLLDMDDSEDEEEEAARYKARLEQRRAQMLESQNLASLESNPKMQPFIAAMEDRDSQIKSLINIDGEDDLFPSMIEGTQVTNQPQGQIEQDAQAEEESQQTQADTFAIPMAGPAKRSRKSARDVRQVLSFLKDDVEGMSEGDGDDMATSRMVDPSFVPGLTRERSSMSIDDRSKTPSLLRGDSLCSRDGAWRDPRTIGLSSARSTESMYAMLSKSRSTGSSSSNAAVEVGMAVTVVSHGVQQLASRKASRSVNYMRVMKDQKQAQSKPKPPREAKRKSSVISLFK